MTILETEFATFILYNPRLDFTKKPEKDNFRYWLTRSDIIALGGNDPRKEKLNVNTYFREGNSEGIDSRRFVFEEARKYNKTLINPAITYEISEVKKGKSNRYARVIDKWGLLVSPIKPPTRMVIKYLDDIVLSSKIQLISKQEYERLNLKPRVMTFSDEKDKVNDYLKDIEKTQLALALLKESMEHDQDVRKVVDAYGLDSVFYYTYDLKKKIWKTEESKLSPFKLLENK